MLDERDGVVEIAVAKYAGFCPGVRRAIRIAEKTLENSSGKVCTVGPLIHNPQVVKGLEDMGIAILPDDRQALREADIAGTSIIIRSHGISPQVKKMLEGKGAELVDATCPTVKKAQRAAIRLVDEGYNLFMVGNADHPEVKAILGHINGEAVVISEPHELKDWWSHQHRRVRKVGIIAQTTVDLFMFRSLVDELVTEIPEFISEVMEVKLINTLCRNTLARQAEAFQLALSSDFVLVLGGKESSNTEFLRKICELSGAATLKIETADELDVSRLQGVERLAILGGASTPIGIVHEVREKALSATR
jgi:4-hydroxy-3-methylbut-2-enyl diphosphate reductase